MTRLLHLVVTFYLLIASLSQFQLTAPATNQPAFASSPAITGITFDDSSVRTLAPGSDNWPITWAANDHLYTSWGDGGGFGGTGNLGRVSLGIGRIEGGADAYVGCNVAGGVSTPGCPPTTASPFVGKSTGILALDNTLYLWRNGNGSNTASYKFSQLYRSDDLGKTWLFTGVEFSKVGGDFPQSQGFFSPTMLQFQQGYEGSRDDYVYIYAPEIKNPSLWNVQKPGEVTLMRVAKNDTNGNNIPDLEEKAQYEFYAGTDGNNQPVWTSTIEDRAPVWADANGTHRMAVSYNAPLQRYILTTITLDRIGRVSFYDAPEPWGPWTHIHTEQNVARWGNKTILFTFVNKWLSADGKSFVLVYAKNDTWTTIKGTFLTDPTSPTPTPPPPVTPTPRNKPMPTPVATAPSSPSPTRTN
jgi:hypothetical protein